ncbi:uncharacterized protein J4E84_010961 [Alternaria hordeiaustralica]|uniref:uncharacterized protein n=1 Tax=Alternaria hordeiaustralica TaxID=1187925 RepID=UPI0020C40B51|nr:uncharacterized protein J4E84_010961 [Alternaria hordeiaustralica]KAI4673730.1 hypothetical protein J4E84_010961 [Alternaria hordeiaustralica]
MRLIDTRTLELRTFVDETHVPPYAILAHTWGEDEVTLQQFTDRSPKANGWKASRGYWKILKACQQALSDRLSLVWVDTCCIDSTSSSDLGETIVSMFRWYQQATVCYAYLDDVNVSSVAKVGGVLNSKYNNDAFAKSRFFTRGWTLQELIAPEHLQFYGAEWRYIGKKDSLLKELECITGISQRILSKESDVLDESIAKRMSWMAGRTTTRVEDIAYCLMGIFDVQMPLLYGERDKAFLRLQEEIMRNSEDHSLLAWGARRSDVKGTLSPIFADHPRQFAASRGIVNRYHFDKDINEQDLIGDDYASTLSGVKITLRVCSPPGPWGALAPEKEDRLAVLECRFEDPNLEGCWPAIAIRRLKGSKTAVYSRIGGTEIFPVVFGEVTNAQKRMGVIPVGKMDGGEGIYLLHRGIKDIPRWAIS